VCLLTVDDGLHDESHRLDTPIICNSDCFHALLVNLSRPDLDLSVRAAQCRLLHDVSLSFMYSELCRNILADSASRRKFLRPSFYFSFKSSINIRVTSSGGSTLEQGASLHDATKNCHYG